MCDNQGDLALSAGVALSRIILPCDTYIEVNFEHVLSSI
jgi:hypothetical protein